VTKKYFKFCLCGLLIILAFQLNAVDRNFQFAWLTDTHVGARTGTEDLRLSVQDINRQNNIDFVIISGDITEYDINGYLDTARVILEELDIPYYLIPGNHDTKWSASGCTKFEKLWNDEEFTFVHKGIKFIGFDQGPIMRMGFGYVVPEDIRWLKNQMSSLTNPSMPIIVITHYPLDSSVGNYRQVLNILKSGNPQVILHGHGHANKIESFAGIPGVMGRSNLRSGQQSGGYNLVKVTNDSIIFRTRITGKTTKPTWHNLLIKRRKYSFQNISNFDNLNQNYPDVKINWQYNSGFSITNAATVERNKVYFGNSSGKLYALSLKNGKKLWTYQTGNRIYSRPAIYKNKVIVNSTDSSVYCLNGNNGNLIWQFKTDGPLVSSPVIKNRTVYIGGSDDCFRAIDINSGREKWQYTNLQGYIETRPLIYKDKAIFGAWDENLYAININNGNLAWKWSDGRNGILYSPAACRPVANDNRIYIVAPDRVLSCIDASSGKTIWRSDRDKVRESIGISENRETVFARCMWDTVFALDVTDRKFEYKWKKSYNYDFDIDPSYPVEEDGTVFFGTGYGDVYAIQRDTGELLWKYRVSNALINNIHPLSSKEAVVTSLDGKITYIKKL
jgi:outer membrane protein assembly factor BamB/Icc-related predicted phosphoesterase